MATCEQDLPPIGNDYAPVILAVASYLGQRRRCLIAGDCGRARGGLRAALCLRTRAGAVSGAAYCSHKAPRHERAGPKLAPRGSH
jgi:hypothetical protein